MEHYDDGIGQERSHRAISSGLLDDHSCRVLPLSPPLIQRDTHPGDSTQECPTPEGDST